MFCHYYLLVPRESSLAQALIRVLTQTLHKALEAWFILYIHLQHPGSALFFGYGVIQSGLNGIPKLCHEFIRSCLGAYRFEFEQRADTDAILQEEAATVGVVLHPRQQIGEGTGLTVESLDNLHC